MKPQFNKRDPLDWVLVVLAGSFALMFLSLAVYIAASVIEAIF